MLLVSYQSFHSSCRSFPTSPFIPCVVLFLPVLSFLVLFLSYQSFHSSCCSFPTSPFISRVVPFLQSVHSSWYSFPTSPFIPRDVPFLPVRSFLVMFLSYQSFHFSWCSFPTSPFIPRTVPLPRRHVHSWRWTVWPPPVLGPSTRYTRSSAQEII